MLKLGSHKGKILSAESKPYSFDGNEGVTHKIRALIGDEIAPLRATPELVNEALTMIGKEVSFELGLTFPKENMRLIVTSITSK